MKDFLDMSGYGSFVWSAFAIAIGGLVFNVWLASRQMRKAREQVRRRLAIKDSA